MPEPLSPIPGRPACDDAWDEVVLQIWVRQIFPGPDEATHLEVVRGSNAFARQHP